MVNQIAWKGVQLLNINSFEVYGGIKVTSKHRVNSYLKLAHSLCLDKIQELEIHEATSKHRVNSKLELAHSLGLDKIQELAIQELTNKHRVNSKLELAHCLGLDKIQERAIQELTSKHRDSSKLELAHSLGLEDVRVGEVVVIVWRRVALLTDEPVCLHVPLERHHQLVVILKLKIQWSPVIRNPIIRKPRNSDKISRERKKLNVICTVKPKFCVYGTG